jgi:hypothetical protein
VNSGGQPITFDIQLYADDIAIFVSSQRSSTERILESVVKIERLNKEVKLEVNRIKGGAGPAEQSGPLGFRIDEDLSGCHGPVPGLFFEGIATPLFRSSITIMRSRRSSLSF